MSSKAWLLLCALAAVAGCAAKAPPPREANAAPATPPKTYSHDPYPSTYHRYPGVLTAITGGVVFDGEGGRIDNGVVILADGVVQAIGGPDTPIPAGAARIDAHGKWVTPGVIDTAFFERRGRPYDRKWPRPLPPERVADAVVRALQSGRAEVFVPGWMTIPSRLRGASPGLFRRLVDRLG